MNYIDLFSGIGGFALGAYWAGIRFDKHYFSEVDKYCVELYRKRFPGAIPLGDITKVKWETLADTEGRRSREPETGNGGQSTEGRGEKGYIITGGFPCQDISIAGKGEGIEGSRSGLWFAMLESIRILRPRFAIIENVGAITFRGLDTVLGTLAEIGYDAEWQDIRASDMGAPHRRERIWIICYAIGDGHENGYQETRRAERQSEQGRVCESQGTGEVMADSDRGQCSRQKKEIRTRGDTVNIGSKDVADTECRDGGGRGTTQQSPDERGGKSETRRESIQSEDGEPCSSDIESGSKDVADNQGERIQGGGSPREQKSQTYVEKAVFERNGSRSRPGQWLSEPEVGRLAHGIPNRVDRLKGLGNAIVPQIAELLFRKILKILNQMEVEHELEGR